MILPIYLYGQPVLRKATEEVTEGELDLKQLIADMWETLAAAEGCGLAAPQVTYLMHELQENGFPVSCDATTVEEAKQEILRVIC